MSKAWKTYMIQSDHGGPVKIGKSRNPSARLRRMQTASPFRLRLVVVLDGDREGELHAMFADSRMHGEWFGPTASMIEFVLSQGVSPRHAVEPGSRLEMGPWVTDLFYSQYGGFVHYFVRDGEADHDAYYDALLYATQGRGDGKPQNDTLMDVAHGTEWMPTALRWSRDDNDVLLFVPVSDRESRREFVTRSAARVHGSLLRYGRDVKIAWFSEQGVVALDAMGVMWAGMPDNQRPVFRPL